MRWNFDFRNWDGNGIGVVTVIEHRLKMVKLIERNASRSAWVDYSMRMLEMEYSIHVNEKR